MILALIIIGLLEEVQVYKVETKTDLILIENEKSLLKQGDIIIELQNKINTEFENPITHELQHEIQESLKNQFSILETYYIYDLENVSKDSKIYGFLSDSQEIISIWIQNQEQLKKYFEIPNFLIGGSRIQIQNLSSFIQLPYSNCLQIFQLEQKHFLIFCPLKNQEKLSLSIVDIEGNVIDEIILQQNANCIQKIELYQNFCIFYEIGCVEFQIQRFEIEITTKKLINQQQLFQIFLRNGTEPLQALQYCSNENIILSFSNIKLYLNINNNQQRIDKSLNNQDTITIYQNCTPYLDIILSQNKENEQQLKSQEMLLNYSSNQIQKFGLVNGNMLLLIDNEIKVFNNIYSNQTINNIIDFAQISNLPFIVSINTKSQMVIYKVQQFQGFVTKKQNSNQLLILSKFKQMIRAENYRILNIFDYNISQNPLLIIKHKNFSSAELRHQKLSLEIFQISHPIVLVRVQSSDLHLSILGTKTEYTCNLNIGQSQMINQQIEQQLNFILIIYQIYNSTKNEYQVYINKCEKEIIKQKTIFVASSKNEIKTIIINEGNYLLAINSEIQLYRIEKDFKAEKIKQYQFNSNIIDVNYQNQFLHLTLTNDTKYCLRKELDFFLNYDCHQNPMQLLQNNKYIISINQQNNSQLFVIYYNKNKYFSEILEVDGQIIQFYQFETFIFRLLIVSLLQNEISIYTFGKQPYQQFQQSQFYFLYKLPLYDFQPVQPICIYIQAEYYAFVAKKSGDFSNYLLIYNSKKPAIQSMVFITQMEREQQFFQWLDNNQFAIYYNNKIIIENSFSQRFDIQRNTFNDDFYIHSQAELVVSSAISSELKTIILNYDYFNFDENLRFKLWIKQEEQYLSIENNKLTRLENIFGPVDEIQLSKDCVGLIQSPFQLSQINVHCNQFINQICVQKDKIIYDPFGIMLKFHIDQTYNIFFVQMVQNRMIVYSFPDHNLLQIQIFEYGSNSEPLIQIIQIQKLTFLSTFYSKPNFQKVNQIIYSEINCVLFVLVMNQNQFALLAQYEFSLAKRQKIFYLEEQQIYIQILAIEQNKIQISNILIENEKNIIFSQGALLNIGQSIMSVEIIKTQLTQKFLVFECLIQGDFNGQSQNIMFKYEVVYDFKNKIIFSKQVIQFFRYFGLFQKINILNNSTFIVQSNELKLNFFKLMPDAESNFTDYYYTYQNENNLLLQQYNNSHILLYEEKLSFYHLGVVQQDYGIDLNNQKQCGIILRNQVSSIEVQVYQKKIVNKINWLYYLIILLNFILILLLLAKQNKQQKMQRERI